MNKQEIFDTVVEHLIKQGKQSIAGDGCVYRGYDGLKCAVGCLIPDEMYSHKMESKSVIKLLERAEFFGYKLPEYFKDNVDILTALQDVHDDNYNWGDCGIEQTGIECLEDIAINFNLIWKYGNV